MLLLGLGSRWLYCVEGGDYIKEYKTSLSVIYFLLPFWLQRSIVLLVEILKISDIIHEKYPFFYLGRVLLRWGSICVSFSLYQILTKFNNMYWRWWYEQSYFIWLQLWSNTDANHGWTLLYSRACPMHLMKILIYKPYVRI